MYELSSIIITGIVGLISTIASGFTSWFFAKRKYNAEVDTNLIANMQQSLDFYKALVEDNKVRLEELIERNNRLEARDATLEEEVRQLKNQMFNLLGQLCVDFSCINRKRSTELFNTKPKHKNNEPKTSKEGENI